MNQEIIEIKEGIKLHLINTNKFKTNLLSVFITTKLDRETVTKNAVIPAVLRRGNKNMRTMEEISTSLENMYGSSFDCGIEKTGDNHILKFYLETINDKYIAGAGDTLLQYSEATEQRRVYPAILESGINILLDIILNPLVENSGFKKEYVEQEKENIKTIIKGKIDDKAQYSFDRCVEEMYKDKPYGLYKYGYAEDLEGITPENLYEEYINLINTCKIDIFISGEFESNQVKDIVNNLEIIKNLKPRTPDYIPNTDEQIKLEVGTNNAGADDAVSSDEPQTITETMNIAQGKLVMGLKVNTIFPECKYIASMYNAILGGTANSKMFQNVREKNSLAYTAGSNFVRQKNNIFIRCGIEIENYKKAVDIINIQLEDMKAGNFTEEDIDNAKKYIVGSVKMLGDEQAGIITYFIANELSDSSLSLEDYINNINKVTKEEIVDLAQSINVEMIYFLKG